MYRHFIMQKWSGEMQAGRRIIWTDVLEITRVNIIEVIRNAMADFTANASDCDKLLAIEAGIMPLRREKKTRTDIDVKTVDPIAHEITEFKEGFHWSNPINFVQRGIVDRGNSEEETKAIALFNECYAAENIGRKQKKVGHFVEICGIGYTFVDIKQDWTDGDSYFQYEALDPRYAFVVKSSVYSDQRVMLGVTFRQDNNGNQYFTAFSKNRRYEILAERVVNGTELKTEWGSIYKDGIVNRLGMIPIIEWERAEDRMGVFEREIPEMERLNLMLSDIGNDIDQETQMIWHTNDVEFPTEIVRQEDGTEKEVVKKPVSNDWVSTFTSREGKTPFIKPLSTNYNYDGLLKNYTSARSLILQRCYTPQRNDNSGGSTGVAMADASGWSAAEQVAASQALLQSSAKIEECKVALVAIKKNTNVPSDSPLLKLRYVDVKPNIKRTKSYELNIKINAYATGISHGIAPAHMIKAINLFEDDEQVIIDSMPYIEKYLESAFANRTTEEAPNADRTMQDESDQVGNSPNIDGTSTDDRRTE